MMGTLAGCVMGSRSGRLIMGGVALLAGVAVYAVMREQLRSLQFVADAGCGDVERSLCAYAVGFGREPIRWRCCRKRRLCAFVLT
jgi:uncharacterized membrane protein